MVINVDNMPQLDALTLAALNATAMRIGLNRPRLYDAETSIEERLRSLVSRMGEVSIRTVSTESSDALAKALLELSAHAAIWAQVVDSPSMENSAVEYQAGMLSTVGVNHMHRRGTPCEGHEHYYTSGGVAWLG